MVSLTANQSVEQGDGCSTGAQWRSSGVRANGANGSYAYPKSVATAFSLPVSSEVLYFVAHGSQLSGSLDVVDDGYEEGVVQVDVTVFYYDDSALDRASVCKLSREGGQNGVGFFTPSRWEFPSGREQIFMKVVAHFPAVHGEGVLRIPAFDTNLPLFSQQLGALEGSVYFDSLALRSSNARIAAQSVKAKSARIETSNSPIEGVYKTDRYLSLVTSNARIQAQVGLYNDDGVRATELVMTTSNSNIESEISMHSTASSHTGGSFKSTLTTKNGRIDVSHPDAPVDALLDFTASSTNSGVTVQLHPAYEGGFELGTSNARAVVDVGGKVPDPKRRGRERRVWQEGGQRGAVRGEVYWEEERRGAGRVVVRSSNSPVMLRL
ncbi:hypothetical protein OE88DRAFT_1747839 [Heliocybe sulcata]|uniref:Uncharacterized protein n=1 Tax=Heliocybe sulcata TaxID=5364 RepID=A0A5C3NAQ7_9AGAM|nr:hypothetical protein OE88DRAFT_1747839 [Heliocybe sulcata]